jgi:hypothetical protein
MKRKELPFGSSSVENIHTHKTDLINKKKRVVCLLLEESESLAWLPQFGVVATFRSVLETAGWLALKCALAFDLLLFSVKVE